MLDAKSTRVVTAYGFAPVMDPISVWADRNVRNTRTSWGDAEVDRTTFGTQKVVREVLGSFHVAVVDNKPADINLGVMSFVRAL